MGSKVGVLVALITTWVALMIGPSWAVSDLDLTSSSTTSYTNCIKSLRNEAKGAIKYFNIPMLPEGSKTLNPKYLYLKLKSSEGTITMAINRTNLYMLGYAGDNARCYLVQDVTEEESKEIFKDPIMRNKLKFKSSYQTIEAQAGVDRKNFGLGIKKLESKVKKVYKADTKQEDEAKTKAEMFLIAIQIISEAARFSYIENQVKSQFKKVEFKPDAKFINLENRWDKLSTAIRGADSKTKEFKKSVDLVDPKGKPYIVTNVDQVKDDIVLLKFVK